MLYSSASAMDIRCPHYRDVLTHMRRDAEPLSRILSLNRAPHCRDGFTPAHAEADNSLPAGTEVDR